jgi:hypothetical protein
MRTMTLQARLIAARLCGRRTVSFYDRWLVRIDDIILSYGVFLGTASVAICGYETKARNFVLQSGQSRWLSCR